MSRFGWSYPAGCSSTPFDEFPPCDVCGKHPDGDGPDGCECPECPVCGDPGNPRCYREHGLPPGPTSIAAFLDHIGIEPLSAALRAIERHNVEHVYLVVGHERLHYWDDASKLDSYPTYAHIDRVGVAGIAWDGSHWEWCQEVDPAEGWTVLDQARQDFHDALEEHYALTEE